MTTRDETGVEKAEPKPAISQQVFGVMPRIPFWVLPNLYPDYASTFEELAKWRDAENKAIADWINNLDAYDVYLNAHEIEDDKEAKEVKVSCVTKQAIASLRQCRKLEKLGYEYIDERGGSLWEIHRGHRVGKRIVDAVVAVDGMGVYVLIE